MANNLVDSSAKAVDTVEKGLELVNKMGPLSSSLGKVWGKIQTLSGMLKSSWNGQFGIPTSSYAMIIGVLVYCVSPLDLIPDVVPVVGYLDDIAFVNGAFFKLDSVIGLY